ncbi:high mobility group B protein 9-like [Phoenix dactylifera]|uniref:High mobility group B protein 9-like n=1 Tax=Phoenix dactylifera TaxID=42345 RepID=A0A8B9A9P4_PHODC|nr:high mobility group B protein 9-like [Phoenix dactylifera]
MENKNNDVTERQVGLEMEGQRIMMENMQVNSYPVAFATQEQVVRDRAIFIETLKQFHAAMGMRFSIPILGGKFLDLHLLYVQVTQSGGIEKVVKEKGWKDVIAAFDFPKTTTSAAYVLKKCYLEILFHYEQVYFFRKQGPVSHTEYLDVKFAKTKINRTKSTSSSAKTTRKRKRNQPEQKTEEICNTPISGVIDGEFEHGYFVTMMMGAQALRGVVYRAKQSLEALPSTIGNTSNAGVPDVSPAQPSRSRAEDGNQSVEVMEE